MATLLTLILLLLPYYTGAAGAHTGILACEGRPRASYKTGFTKYPRADREGFYGGFGKWARFNRRI